MSVELDILGGLEGEMVVVVLINDNATERWYFILCFFLSWLGVVAGPSICWALTAAHILRSMDPYNFFYPSASIF